MARLEVGHSYAYHGRGGGKTCLLVWRENDDGSYKIRSSITGWTMDIYDVCVYPDGTIDWSYSRDCYYTDITDGVMIERRF